MLPFLWLWQLASPALALPLLASGYRLPCVTSTHCHPTLLHRRHHHNSTHGPSTAIHPTTVPAAAPSLSQSQLAADRSAFPPGLRPACVAVPHKRPRVLRQRPPLACRLASCLLCARNKRRCRSRDGLSVSHSRMVGEYRIRTELKLESMNKQIWGTSAFQHAVDSRHGAK
jgi:hypothetical protein